VENVTAWGKWTETEKGRRHMREGAQGSPEKGLSASLSGSFGERGQSRGKEKTMRIAPILSAPAPGRIAVAV